MKKSFIFIFISLFLCQPAFADDVEEVDQLIRGTVDTVFTIINDKDLEESVKKEKIMAVVTRIFNLSLMAKLTLGRKHWTGLNSEQREEFTDLFIKQMKSTYLGQVEIAADFKVLFERPIQQKNKMSMLVRAKTKDEPIKILYKLYKSKSQWQIYDVEIQGVSVIKSYGSQYSQVLKEGTYADLAGRMKEKLDRNEKEIREQKGDRLF
jgi:phospholipid transport system substrate-binding protein